MDKRRLFKLLFVVIGMFLVVYLISLSCTLFWGEQVNQKKSGKVALIEVEGIIISAKDFIQLLKKCENDDSIKAVVLRIDSPGGSVVPAQEMYKALIDFRKKTQKKVIASFGNIAASGGYYIACAADKIVSNPGTITGSIAVIMKIPNLEELFKKIGFKEQTIKSGRLKDLGSISKTLTPEESEVLKNMISDVHEQFVEAVSKGRNLDVDYVKQLADGRIFSGRQAKEIKLVDRLGTYDEAIDFAKKMVGLPKEAKVIKIIPEETIYHFFRGFFTQKIFSSPWFQPSLAFQYIN